MAHVIRAEERKTEPTTNGKHVPMFATQKLQHYPHKSKKEATHAEKDDKKKKKKKSQGSN